MTPTSVAGFILLDSGFPRSIRHCARQLTDTLRQLMSRSEFEGLTFDEQHLEKLRQSSSMTPEEIIHLGLNQYLDDIQVTLIDLGNQIAQQFFMAQYAGR